MVWEIERPTTRSTSRRTSRSSCRAATHASTPKDGALQARVDRRRGAPRRSTGASSSPSTLDGDVVLWLDDLELRTDEATYDRARDLITAPGAVDDHADATSTCRRTGMEVDVTPAALRLLDDVHTVLRSDAATS